MQTETLYLPKSSPRDQTLSPALISASSHRCWIATESGHAVRLSLAGYMLHFWASYRVCFSEPVKDLRLTAYPNHFIKKQSETTAASSKHNESFKYVPIRASYQHWWDSLTHHGNYPHEIELEVTFPDDRKTTVTLPIILQMRLPLRILLIIAIAFFWIPYGIARDAISGWDVSSVFSWKSWGFGVLSALAYVTWYICLCVWSLRARAIELHEQFQERWSGRCG